MIEFFNCLGFSMPAQEGFQSDMVARDTNQLREEMDKVVKLGEKSGTYVIEFVRSNRSAVQFNYHVVKVLKH